MKKIIVIFVCYSCLCLCACTNNKIDFNYTNEEQIKKEIIINLEKVLEVTDNISSNPFLYTQNEYYDNIINLGKYAVFVLEDMYKSGELVGLNAYLSALAIEDITGCDLYDKYSLDWSTAEEFYTLWNDNNCSFKK